jgi:hypothetical protein
MLPKAIARATADVDRSVDKIAARHPPGIHPDRTRTGSRDGAGDLDRAFTKSRGLTAARFRRRSQGPARGRR